MMIAIRRQAAKAFPPRPPGLPDLVHEPKLYFNTTYMCGTNIIVSSTDSDLEAFSHNPADGSFAAMPCQTAAKTNYLKPRFLSY